MSRRLPPLNGLRAFEAAARYLSFTRAAEELSVTPAAVSQQVKALENYFDTRLFRRMTRALMLTEAGQAVLPLLKQGFDKLAEADRLLRSRRDDKVVNVSVSHSFGAKWLVPRLDSFRRACPEYEIRIDATDRPADFSRENADIALRYGSGHYPGLSVECVMEEFVIPVCSPQLMQGDHPLRTPDDLRHHTLLHLEWSSDYDPAPNWGMWLKAAGIEDIDSSRGPRFSMSSMAIQAALEGQGVALVSRVLASNDLRRGRLVRPFPKSSNQKTSFCYYMVYPEAHLERARVAAFREWVLDEVRAGVQG